VVERLLDLVRDVPVREVAEHQRTNVWWVRETLEQFAADAERWAPLETGAAILGYRGDDGSVVVLDLVPGGPRARRRRTAFVPDARWQIAEIHRRYRESGRIARYLGEIHSHPSGSCALSRRDRRTVRRIAHHAAARLDRPLMAVAAGAERLWLAKAWEFVAGVLRPCTSYVITRKELEIE
jgi:integrative and conjugative element protein (TIGR02256 family)